VTRWQRLGWFGWGSLLATLICLLQGHWGVARAKEPTLPDWQIVTQRAECFETGDRVDLRTNDGVQIRYIAGLKVAHIDGKRNVVTFVERQP
jgi:hypothetical protein